MNVVTSLHQGVTSSTAFDMYGCQGTNGVNAEQGDWVVVVQCSSASWSLLTPCMKKVHVFWLLFAYALYGTRT